VPSVWLATCPTSQNAEMTEAIILCGGAGLRLRSVTGNDPKSMARVAGGPFLGMLLKQLRRHAFQRVILAVGYAGAAIQSYFGEGFGGMDVVYSNESSPLGTGGAVGNAARLIQSRSCLVMNGDSYTDVDLGKFSIGHGESETDVSVVVVPVDERSDVGSVLIDADNNIIEFAEKTRPPIAAHLNAGIYILSSGILSGIPPGLPISLERELIPKWIREGRRLRAFVYSGKCVDIGTPERYRAAQEILAHIEFAPAGARNEEDRA
jgi:NDP-sugar pyrophosphorylase family protein